MGVSDLLLVTGRLRVRIAAPGTVYRGSRFDWTGTVTEVKLDGAHTFCTPESLIDGQGTGGIGLCNEFGISEPIGYEECPVGGAFPKIGVGLLTKLDDSPYSFARPYPVVPFDCEVETGEASSTFTLHPTAVNGYAVRLVKKLSVADNRLRFSYALENVGDKPIVTTEYGHNFVHVNGEPIGPGYSLRLSESFAYSPSGNGDRDPLLFANGTMRWRHIPKEAFYCRSTGSYTPGIQWELLHESGVGLRETVDFTPSLLALWGTDHVVSPEVFIRLEVKPGETVRWTRELEFFTNDVGSEARSHE